MNNWDTIELGEIVKSGGGKIHTGPFGSQLHASDYVASGIPCIMPANMVDSRVDLSKIAYITDADAQRLSKYLVDIGDIVYSRRGDVTLKALIREHETGYFCGTGCLLLRPGSKIDSEFLTYYLSTASMKEWIKQQAVGATMPNLNTGILARIPFTAPEKAEQQKLSKVISLINKKIEFNNKINNELEVMAKLIYDYWFVQFDFPDDSGKPYKSSGGKMVYNEELKREIPSGWLAATLLDIASFTNGIACQKYRPDDGEDYYKVIKIREMGTGFTDKSEFVSKKIPEKVIVNNGDVLFSWSATLDVKIWSGGVGGLNQHIFKVTSDNYPRTYFYFEVLRYLQHFKMIAELRKTTMGHITQDHLKQSRIPIAPKRLINDLHAKLDPIINKTVKAKEENLKLQQLRDWLLPMLMNGQVTVKDA